MDSQFLEFMGNCFISAAKGRKQVEDLEKWMSRGSEGFNELPELFKKFYGLEHMQNKSPDYTETWDKFLKDFKKIFSDYLSFFNMASFEEHLALVKKYETLKQKAAEQEDVIKKLRSRSGKGFSEQEEITANLQSMIKDQTDQFQKMMDSFGQYAKSSVQTSARRRKKND